MTRVTSVVGVPSTHLVFVILIMFSFIIIMILIMLVFYYDDDHKFHHQCLKLMITQSPLLTKNWAGLVKFDHGQVKIIIEYIMWEIFLIHVFLGDKRKF